MRRLWWIVKCLVTIHYATSKTKTRWALTIVAIVQLNGMNKMSVKRSQDPNSNQLIFASGRKQLTARRELHRPNDRLVRQRRQRRNIQYIYLNCNTLIRIFLFTYVDIFGLSGKSASIVCRNDRMLLMHELSMQRRRLGWGFHAIRVQHLNDLSLVELVRTLIWTSSSVLELLHVIIFRFRIHYSISPENIVSDVFF